MLLRLGVFLFTVLIIKSAALSQEYKFERIYAQNTILKTSGRVIIANDTLTIIQNNTTSKLPIGNYTVDQLDYKQFKIDLENTDYDIRISLNLKSRQSKKETGTMLYQMRDNFNGNRTSILYYLIPATEP